jgi:predicted DNA-binding WGR domain protein
MRSFEFVEGSSSNFWSPELRGSTFIVTYGRIGTAGQSKKAFPDEASARHEYEKKVAEKLPRATRRWPKAVGRLPSLSPRARRRRLPPSPSCPLGCARRSRRRSRWRRQPRHSRRWRLGSAIGAGG